MSDRDEGIEFRIPFDPEKPYYEFVIDGDGPVVYSECCADRLTPEAAREVRDALTVWLNKRDGVDAGTGEAG